MPDRVVSDDHWRDRITLVSAAAITAICLTGDMVLGILGKPPSAFLLTAGTVALTVIAGYGKAGFNAFRQRRTGHDNAVSPNGQPETSQVVNEVKKK